MDNNIERAFGKITSRIQRTTTRQTRNNRQRRYLVTDDFDKEYSTVANDDVTGLIYLSISSDMTYIERWEFKMIVERETEADFETLRIILDEVDLTNAFKAQFPNWVTGTGMYPDETVNNRYNILEAIDTIPEAQRTAILKQGYHKLEFVANGLFSVKIREFKKYAFINRQGGSHDGNAESNERTTEGN